MNQIILLNTSSTPNNIIGKLEILDTNNLDTIINNLGLLVTQIATRLNDSDILMKMNDPSVKGWTLSELSAIKSLLKEENLDFLLVDVTSDNKDYPVSVLYEYQNREGKLFNEALLVHVEPSPLSLFNAALNLNLDDYFTEKFVGNRLKDRIEIAKGFYNSFGYVNNKDLTAVIDCISSLGINMYVVTNYE